MGYPMAINLRKGLDSSYTLLICDVVENALSRFQREADKKGPVEVIRSGYEAVQKAVRQRKLQALRTKPNFTNDIEAGHGDYHVTGL